MKKMQSLGVGRPSKSYITLREEETWAELVHEGDEEGWIFERVSEAELSRTC